MRKLHIVEIDTRPSNCRSGGHGEFWTPSFLEVVLDLDALCRREGANVTTVKEHQFSAKPVKEHRRCVRKQNVGPVFYGRCKFPCVIRMMVAQSVVKEFFPNSNNFGLFSHSKGSKGFGAELLSDSQWFSGADPFWAAKRFCGRFH